MRARVFFPFIGAVEDRLWAEMDERMSDLWASDAKILCIGFSGSEAADLDSIFRLSGASAIAYCSTFGWEDSSRIIVSSFSHVIVSLCNVDCAASTFGFLLELRASCPDVVVICVDCSVYSDDLSAERVAFCHATLRGPLSEAQLRNGFIAASQNFSLEVDRRSNG